MQVKQKATSATISESLKYNSDRIAILSKKQKELKAKKESITAALHDLKKMREQVSDQQQPTSGQQAHQSVEQLQQTLGRINIRRQELEVILRVLIKSKVHAVGLTFLYNLLIHLNFVVDAVQRAQLSAFIC